MMPRWVRGIFHNWRVKLACLAAAILLWLFIKHNITESSPSQYAPSAILPGG